MTESVRVHRRRGISQGRAGVWVGVRSMQTSNSALERGYEIQGQTEGLGDIPCPTEQLSGALPCGELPCAFFTAWR